MLKIILY